MKVNVLVLNYNGKALLEEYLPSLVDAAKHSRYRCRLGVVDNQSCDGSVDFVKKNFPDADVYVTAENRVLCSYNEIAHQLADDILIFMNNDIRVEKDFIDPLVRPLAEDSAIFLVTPKCLSLKGGAYEGNRTRGRIRFGIYWSSALYPGYEKHIDRLGLTMHAGFGAFDRKKFLELGGYDDLYLPGRLEDADICFRAYKMGWKCLYQPESVVYHQGGASFKKEFGDYKTLVISARNTYLFMWKNLSDTMTLFRFIFWLPWRMSYAVISGHMEYVVGLFQALSLWPKVRQRRARLAARGLLKTVPDHEIFSQV